MSELRPVNNNDVESQLASHGTVASGPPKGIEKTCKANCNAVFSKMTVSLTGYDKIWPLAFGVSSLDCLGAGGKGGKNAKWSAAYFAVRVFLFLVMFATLVWSLYDNRSDPATTTIAGSGNCTDPVSAPPDPRKWPVFLTHQMLTLQTIYLLVCVITTWKAKDYVSVPVPGNTPAGPWYVHVQWVLQGITTPGTFLVFTVYWGLVYDGGSPGALTFMVHGVNFLVSAIDWSLSKAPYFYAHVLWFWLFCIYYLLVTIIYWAATDEAVYSAFDYSCTSGPITAGLFIIVVIPVVDLLFVTLIQMCRICGDDVVRSQEEGIVYPEIKHCCCPCIN